MKQGCLKRVRQTDDLLGLWTQMEMEGRRGMSSAGCQEAANKWEPRQDLKVSGRSWGV